MSPLQNTELEYLLELCKRQLRAIEYDEYIQQAPPTKEQTAELIMLNNIICLLNGQCVK